MKVIPTGALRDVVETLGAIGLVPASATLEYDGAYAVGKAGELGLAAVAEVDIEAIVEGKPVGTARAGGRRQRRSSGAGTLRIKIEFEKAPVTIAQDARTRELIDECACQSGCPSCVGPEGATGPLAKAVASRLLERLMAARAAYPCSPAAAGRPRAVANGTRRRPCVRGSRRAPS